VEKGRPHFLLPTPPPVLEWNPGPSCTLGRHSTTALYPSPMHGPHFKEKNQCKELFTIKKNSRKEDSGSVCVWV
jgi:hypothetical protein